MQTRLIIKDEVNCKFEGLDLATRKKLVDKFKYDVPNARHLPAVKLGRWDGRVAYFQLSGTTYINLLPDVLTAIQDAGYDIEVEDLREYRTQFDFTEFQEDTFSDCLWPVGHPNVGEPIVFRDYQVEIINNFFQNPQSVQEVATGAGKTIMTAALSKSTEAYGRSIIIVPNKDLVKQTEADYRNMGLEVGVYFGERKEYGFKHTICTWQSLNVMLKNTKNHEAEITIGEFIEDVVCLIVDEVHMAKADVLKELLTGVMSHIPIRWGFTGTIPKESYEQVSIFCSLGPVVGKLAASTLQEAGHLANCHVNIVQLVDHVEYKDYQSELKYLLETSGRLDYIANLVKSVNATGNTLVLVDRLATGKALEERLENAVFLSGSTKGTARQEEYAEFAEAEGKIAIATYGIAAVGLNIPRIFNLVLIEPGKSFVRVIQSIGRGIRKAEDKDFVQIWDITSTCKFAKRHLTKRRQFYKDANYPFTTEKGDWQ